MIFYLKINRFERMMILEKYKTFFCKGATKNGQPIKSKSETKLNKAVINTEFGSSREPERIATVIDNMKKIVLAPSR